MNTLKITTYMQDEEIMAGTVKVYLPIVPDSEPAQPDTSDPDCGTYVVLLAPIAVDLGDQSGRVLVLTGAGARVVPSVSVGVWVAF